MQENDPGQFERKNRLDEAYIFFFGSIYIYIMLFIVSITLLLLLLVIVGLDKVSAITGIPPVYLVGAAVSIALLMLWVAKRKGVFHRWFY